MGSCDTIDDSGASMLDGEAGESRLVVVGSVASPVLEGVVGSNVVVASTKEEISI